jgi:microcystin-dependent protein
VWADPELSYKFVLKDSSDVTQWTVDNVIGQSAVDAVGPTSIQDEAIESEHLSTKAIHEQTQDTTPAKEDEVITYDTSAAALKRVTLDDIINLITPTGIWAPYSGTTAPGGWVMMSNRTIGSAASSATERANADTSDLYVLLWNSYTNTELVIQDSAGSNTTRGANAAADFAANKRMPLPDMRGRIVAGKDDMGGSAASRLTNSANGFGTSAATLGAVGGSQSHTLTTAQLASHSHGWAYRLTAFTEGGGNTANMQRADVANDTGSVSVSTTGSDTAHNNVQPTMIANWIIKL